MIVKSKNNKMALHWIRDLHLKHNYHILQCFWLGVWPSLKMAYQWLLCMPIWHAQQPYGCCACQIWHAQQPYGCFACQIWHAQQPYNEALYLSSINNVNFKKFHDLVYFLSIMGKKNMSFRICIVSLSIWYSPFLRIIIAIVYQKI